MTRRGFGNIRKLPSGRLQIRYTGPNGRTYTAPVTFDTRTDADAWLAGVRTDIVRGDWTDPDHTIEPVPVLTLNVFSAAWLAGRELKPRTRAGYRRLLDRLILPVLGDRAVDEIKPADVRAWHADLSPDTPTLRSHAYSLLRTLMNSAVAEEIITANPCRIRAAGTSRRVHKPRILTVDELARLVDAMPERFRAAVMLAAFCGFRWGELAELRRSDVDLDDGVIRVRRAVVVASDDDAPLPPGSAHCPCRPGCIVGPPKSAAGVRDVHVPPHVYPALEHHLDVHAAKGRNGLLFPSATGGHLAQSTVNRYFFPARKAIGAPDVRWHDLRHLGSVMAAAAGGTMGEIMQRLGHSSPDAALRYVHAAAGRDAEIAARLSQLLEK